MTPLSALGASARAEALGDAFVGLSDDPSAVFFNPAGLSQLRAAGLSLNHNSYLAGSFEETLLFGLPAGSWGGFAGALQYVNWGGLDQRDAFGVSQGTFTDGDVAFSLGWGATLAPGFSFGAGLQGVQQKIIDSLYTQLSGNLGLLLVPAPNFRLGLSYSGLGTPLAGFTQAQDLRLGLSLVLELGGGTDLKPLLAGDWEPNGVSRIQGGLEGVIGKNYFLRLGFQAALSDNQIGGLTGLTAGAGVKAGPVLLDYAFVPYGDLGTTHRISVGYEFSDKAAPPPKPVTVMASPVTVLAPPVTVLATVGPASVTTEKVKSKVEVRFELTTDTGMQGSDSQALSLAGPYEKEAKENPGDSRAWRNLGIVYLKTGQKDLAIQCFEQALRLNQDDLALKKWLDDYHARRSGKTQVSP